MTTSTAAASPPSSLAPFRSAARKDPIPFLGTQAPAYLATVFVGAWNASGVRVPSTREHHDPNGRCAGCR